MARHVLRHDVTKISKDRGTSVSVSAQPWWANGKTGWTGTDNGHTPTFVSPVSLAYGLIHSQENCSYNDDDDNNNSIKNSSRNSHQPFDRRDYDGGYEDQRRRQSEYDNVNGDDVYAAGYLTSRYNARQQQSQSEYRPIKTQQSAYDNYHEQAADDKDRPGWRRTDNHVIYPDIFRGVSDVSDSTSTMADESSIGSTGAAWMGPSGVTARGAWSATGRGMSTQWAGETPHPRAMIAFGNSDRFVTSIRAPAPRAKSDRTRPNLSRSASLDRRGDPKISTAHYLTGAGRINSAQRVVGGEEQGERLPHWGDDAQGRTSLASDRRVVPQTSISPSRHPLTLSLSTPAADGFSSPILVSPRVGCGINNRRELNFYVFHEQPAVIPPSPRRHDIGLTPLRLVSSNNVSVTSPGQTSEWDRVKQTTARDGCTQTAADEQTRESSHAIRQQISSSKVRRPEKRQSGLLLAGFSTTDEDEQSPYARGRSPSSSVEVQTVIVSPRVHESREIDHEYLKMLRVPSPIHWDKLDSKLQERRVWNTDPAATSSPLGKYTPTTTHRSATSSVRTVIDDDEENEDEDSKTIVEEKTQSLAMTITEDVELSSSRTARSRPTSPRSSYVVETFSGSVSPSQTNYKESFDSRHDSQSNMLADNDNITSGRRGRGDDFDDMTYFSDLLLRPRDFSPILYKSNVRKNESGDNTGRMPPALVDVRRRSPLSHVRRKMKTSYNSYSDTMEPPTMNIPQQLEITSPKSEPKATECDPNSFRHQEQQRKTNNIKPENIDQWTSSKVISASFDSDTNARGKSTTDAKDDDEPRGSHNLHSEPMSSRSEVYQYNVTSQNLSTVEKNRTKKEEDAVSPPVDENTPDDVERRTSRLSVTSVRNNYLRSQTGDGQPVSTIGKRTQAAFDLRERDFANQYGYHVTTQETLPAPILSPIYSRGAALADRYLSPSSQSRGVTVVENSTNLSRSSGVVTDIASFTAPSSKGHHDVSERYPSSFTTSPTSTIKRYDTSDDPINIYTRDEYSGTVADSPSSVPRFPASSSSSHLRTPLPPFPCDPVSPVSKSLDPPPLGPPQPPQPPPPRTPPLNLLSRSSDTFQNSALSISSPLPPPPSYYDSTKYRQNVRSSNISTTISSALPVTVAVSVKTGNLGLLATNLKSLRLNDCSSNAGNGKAIITEGQTHLTAQANRNVTQTPGGIHTPARGLQSSQVSSSSLSSSTSTSAITSVTATPVTPPAYSEMKTDAIRSSASNAFTKNLTGSTRDYSLGQKSSPPASNTIMSPGERFDLATTKPNVRPKSTSGLAVSSLHLSQMILGSDPSRSLSTKIPTVYKPHIDRSHDNNMTSSDAEHRESGGAGDSLSEKDNDLEMYTNRKLSHLDNMLNKAEGDLVAEPQGIGGSLGTSTSLSSNKMIWRLSTGQTQAPSVNNLQHPSSFDKHMHPTVASPGVISHQQNASPSGPPTSSSVTSPDMTFSRVNLVPSLRRDLSPVIGNGPKRSLKVVKMNKTSNIMAGDKNNTGEQDNITDESEALSRSTQSGQGTGGDEWSGKKIGRSGISGNDAAWPRRDVISWRSLTSRDRVDQDGENSGEPDDWRKMGEGFKDVAYVTIDPSEIVTSSPDTNCIAINRPSRLPKPNSILKQRSNTRTVTSPGGNKKRLTFETPKPDPSVGEGDVIVPDNENDIDMMTAL